MQYPEYQLFEETVIKDVCFGPLNMGLSHGGGYGKGKVCGEYGRPA